MINHPIDVWLETGRRDHLPPLKDRKAVVALFDDREIREWVIDWPLIDHQPPAPPKKTGKRGRPPGKMSDAKRAARWPVHHAAHVAEKLERILKGMYWGHLKKEYRPLAYEIASNMTGVPLPTLLHYIDRPKKNRRRVTSGQ